MTDRFQGKTALVTGSSRGIGRAIAERLADHGAGVVVHYASRAELANDVVRGITARGGRAVALGADVTSQSQVRGLFDRAEQTIGPLDIVVANAAVAMAKPLVECTEDIVVISTGGTKMWFDQLSLYLGSKGAVEQFVRVLSRELGPRQITVNVVSPGYTDTEMLMDRDRPVAAKASPFNRIGTTADVADAVVLLASDEARWITGQNIAAGGGVF
jgi:3-oxoacyl-[acyl-carrier protein] reductase